MVARGDLGIETDLSNLPNIQRKIMSNCAKHGVRSIVATHLLESMIENPTPTRAEVTDVANAIYEGRRSYAIWRNDHRQISSRVC